MILTAAHKQTLKAVARRSIEHGLAEGNALRVDVTQYDARLQRVQSSFVTLHLQGSLRGCIGGLKPWQPLVQDVAEHAYMAAFSDHRFEPLSRAELDALQMHLSVLSPREALDFDGVADLLHQMRPNVDGLIIARGDQRATFLPSVWDMIPQPEQFLAHLKRKAGIPEDAADFSAWRYTAESF